LTKAEYSVRDVVAYMLLALSGRVRGLKKLVKLLFLVQYERRGLLWRREVVKYTVADRPATATEFIIWEYGPFSRDIYDVLDDEQYFEILDPEPPVVIGLTHKGKELAQVAGKRLPEPLRQRIRIITKRYGNWTGAQLAEHVYKMLLLDPGIKEEYIGVSVDKYLRERGIQLREEELI